MKHQQSLLLLVAITLTPALTLADAPGRQFGGPALARDDFNRIAVLQDRPLFWLEDRNKDGLINPDELAAAGHDGALKRFVKGAAFTPLFKKVYAKMVEHRRQEAVARELNGGRPTMVHNDLTGASAVDRAVLKELLAASAIIERLYARQTGAAKHLKAIKRADPASRYLFWRNHGPGCNSPETAGDNLCNALPGFPDKRSEAYPQDAPQDEKMCKALQAHPDSKALLNPFTVVRKGKDGKLEAVPYNKIWGKQMMKVAARLRAAAKAVAADPKEKAFHKYLIEAAKGFETNFWEDADEAWAAMNAQNSRWYLRIGPDEVYFDPCQQKAGFHVSMALIDQASLKWQRRLTPIRKEMEEALAKQIGEPYKAREVRFHMPDFINVVLNAGDARHPLGATIGQSLPNWGKVAREGRGRTVVMSNLYTDADSKRVSRAKAKALLTAKTMAHFTSDAEPFLVNIILHEACHNFGPHSDYRIKGKAPKEIFGGKLASTMEELKAQTGGLWFLGFLKKKGLITEAQLNQSYTQAITWAFGHISRGMFTPSGNVRVYSQLAAVQLGFFIKVKAITYKKGKFTIHFKKLAKAIDKLMTQVGQMKATGDKDGARKLIDHYVTGEGKKLVRMGRISKEVLRFPKASFRYSVVY